MFDAERCWGPKPRRFPKTSPPVPASTSIRCSRVRYIDTDRLLRRLAYLGEHLADRYPNPLYESRADFRGRVREIIAVEDELDRRDIEYTRVSRRAS